MTIKTSEQRHKYYIEHKETLLRQNKASHLRHKETRLKSKREYTNKYRLANLTLCRKRVNDNAKKLREQVISHYSNETNRCNICGETDLVVLCLDHINNDGAEERRRLGAKALFPSYYRWLIKENYSSKLQVLCCNCNQQKEYQRRQEDKKNGD